MRRVVSSHLATNEIATKHCFELWFKNGNFLSRYYILYFKRMISGCENFLWVFQSLKCQSLDPTELTHVLLLVCIIYQEHHERDVRRFQGSSIDRQIWTWVDFKFEYDWRTNKNLSQAIPVLNCVSYFGVIRWWRVDLLVAIEMTVVNPPTRVTLGELTYDQAFFVGGKRGRQVFFPWLYMPMTWLLRSFELYFLYFRIPSKWTTNT